MKKFIMYFACILAVCLTVSCAVEDKTEPTYYVLKIDYHLNGGFFSKENGYNLHYINRDTPLNIPEKDFYTFVGWYTSPDFKDDEYLKDDIISKDYSNTKSDKIDLYAKYEPTQISLYYFYTEQTVPSDTNPTKRPEFLINGDEITIENIDNYELPEIPDIGIERKWMVLHSREIQTEIDEDYYIPTSLNTFNWIYVDFGKGQYVNNPMNVAAKIIYTKTDLNDVLKLHHNESWSCYYLTPTRLLNN